MISGLPKSALPIISSDGYGKWQKIDDAVAAYDAVVSVAVELMVNLFEKGSHIIFM